MTISRAELFQELIRHGVSKEDAIQRVQQLDSNDSNGQINPQQDSFNDGFTPSNQDINDPNTAFLRAGAQMTVDDLIQQAADAIPDVDLNSLQNQFMDVASGLYDTDIDAETRQKLLERKWSDRVDARLRHDALMKKLHQTGIDQTLMLSKSSDRT